VVCHSQSELIAVVTDLDLDLSSLAMPEGVPQGFRSNLVDLVTHDRAQISRVSLGSDTECRRGFDTRSGRKLVAKRLDRQREIVAFDGRRPQALHRVAT